MVVDASLGWLIASCGLALWDAIALQQAPDSEGCLQMAAANLPGQLEIVRARLESTLPIPMLLVFASARDDDGKEVAARALAQSMAEARYSTLLVTSGQATRERVAGVECRSLADISDFAAEGGFTNLPRAGHHRIDAQSRKAAQTIPRETVRRFAETCRNSYQVTIVEPGDVVTNSFAMLASLAADGVILTIRERRRVCAADRLLKKTLALENVPVIGVVSVAAATIRNDRRDQSYAAAFSVKGAIPNSKFGPSRTEEVV